MLCDGMGPLYFMSLFINRHLERYLFLTRPPLEHAFPARNVFLRYSYPPQHT